MSTSERTFDPAPALALFRARDILTEQFDPALSPIWVRFRSSRVDCESLSVNPRRRSSRFSKKARKRSDVLVTKRFCDSLLRRVTRNQKFTGTRDANSAAIFEWRHTGRFRKPAEKRASLQSRDSRHRGKRDAASVPHVYPFLNLQDWLVAVRLQRRKTDKIGAGVAGVVGQNKLGGFCLRRRAEDPANEKQTDIDPRKESASSNDIPIIDDAPISVDCDFGKPLR